MLDERTKKLEDKIDELDAKITRIAAYIDSDPATNRDGIVASLDKLVKTVDDLLVREQVYKTKAGTFGFIGAIIAGVLWKGASLLIAIAK